MTTPATTESPRQKLIVQDDSAVANLMDTGRFEHMMRIAGAMAGAALIPDHLWGRKKAQNIEPFTPDQVRANCFLIVNQSLRWGLDPFAVMPETYVVGGKLAYQGKLIAAVVNARADLEGRLDYTFTGKVGADDLTVTVSGKFRGASKASEITLSVGQAKTDNMMWRKDPEQKLIYSGVVKWARRYCPEIVLGIISDDDADADAMRPAVGREVPTTAATHNPNPFAEEAVEVPTDPAPAATEAPAEVLPSKEEMVQAIRAAISAAGVKNIEAAEIFRGAGLLQAALLQDATDAELFAITKRLDLLPAKQEAPAAEAQPAAEGKEEAPSGKTDAQRKDDALASIEEQLLGFDDIDLNTFGKMCREQKLMGATQALRSLGHEKLENIAGSVAFIIKTAREGGDQ